MTLYAPEFQFEDVNFDLRINSALPALRAFFEGFIIENPAASYNKFDVFDYVGDERLGSFPWTWETKHAGDSLVVDAKGQGTKTERTSVAYGKSVTVRVDLGAARTTQQ